MDRPDTLVSLGGRQIWSEKMNREEIEILPSHDRFFKGKPSFRYVRLDEIPEPHRIAFWELLYGRGIPLVEGEGICAYAADWLEYLRRLAKS